MKHLGDITKINGAEIEPVHCIIGGSPCQDLSIAGKRAGLSGERSGLFMEQVRIVKEMREKYGTAYPRFLVWENVPGAFSSNKGADFAAVLTEIIRIVEPEAPCVAVPAKGWSTWGGFRDMDGRWSVAWRVHDAQYWGVPQRRRRIALVADFGGDTASEILFDRKSVSRHPAESRASREGFTEAAESGFNPAVARSLTARADGSPCADRGPNIVCSPYQGGCDGGGKGALVQTEKSGTLGTGNDQTIFCLATQQGGAELRTDDRAPTLTAAAGMSGNNQPVVAIPINDKATRWQGGGESRNHDGSGNGLGIGKEGDPSPTLTAGDRHGVMSLTAGSYMQVEEETSPTIMARDYKDFNVVCYGIGRDTFNQGQNMAVRRLTPTEGERLQGFPDGWTDIGDWVDGKGKKHKSADSPRYKALGNSIALPFWQWMLRRMCEISGARTMGSLFDGIGGFPLCWERINGDGSCRWASEIEEFPIAVTKRHFKEE